MSFPTLLAVSDGAIFAGAGGVMLFVLVIIGILSVFWIWMLIDCLTSSLAPMEKIIWLLVIFWLHFIGAALYYAIGRTHSSGGGRIGMA